MQTPHNNKNISNLVVCEEKKLPIINKYEYRKPSDHLSIPKWTQNKFSFFELGAGKKGKENSTLAIFNKTPVEIEK